MADALNRTDAKSKKILRWILILFVTTIFLFLVISLYRTDKELRYLSEKRIRYFKSFLFSAAYSEEPINSFEQLKAESYVAAENDLFERLYFGWPLTTPKINVYRVNKTVCVEEDREYPVSFFKRSRIVLKVDVDE